MDSGDDQPLLLVILDRADVADVALLIHQVRHQLRYSVLVQTQLFLKFYRVGTQQLICDQHLLRRERVVVVSVMQMRRVVNIYLDKATFRFVAAILVINWVAIARNQDINVSLSRPLEL